MKQKRMRSWEALNNASIVKKESALKFLINKHFGEWEKFIQLNFAQLSIVAHSRNKLSHSVLRSGTFD